ncbi:MAG: isoleucine-tRNA ligase [Panacagrimonas sp.]|nr:isoleucine--tRNA ligase [Panacagrimonas sp.]MCC2654990.1 isoleucine-tRNA ligase [Panacagrimonas sp.]
MDYKITLNLPETPFPMQANLAKREPEFLARWEAEDLYAQIQQDTRDGESYRFVDGPPYANGDIHIGHAVNKVLKDLIVKSRRLAGRHAPFVPGWDCHGLPIELQVEKKHGKVGEKLDAASFRAKCREYANEQIGRQRADFKRLGILADWERPYLTMDPKFEAEQLRCLGRIVERGHVVRGFKPVHWCLDCGSSLAEAEVEYEDKQSFAIDVRFEAFDPADLARRFGVADASGAGFVIWTTTPWTLPANQAIAANAQLNYALVRAERAGLVVLAADMVEAVLKRWQDQGQVIATVAGSALEGALAQHPFADRRVPLILGEHVTTEAGTGLVHTAPAHGVEDYVVGQQYKLTVYNPVLSSGVYAADAPLVAGMHVRKVDEPILAELETRGALIKRATLTHSFPHCWRHKSPLIFRATPQWFVSMDGKGLRPQALEAIAKTQWIPNWGEARIREMVAGRPDWCISRQRTWGVPMAVFVHRQKQDLHPDSVALLARIADKVEKEGLEAWFGSSPADWGVDEGVYEKCPDTLDVWFDSGVVHQCSFKALEPETLDANGNAPIGDLYLEGSDQHRGWFQSSLLTSTAMHGRAPYRAVLTHGFTVDEQGRKMSKSLGNVVAPQQVTKTLGADVLRLWVAASDYSGEIAISDKLLTRMADAYRRIRNTARFLLGNLHGFDPARDLVPTGRMVAIDRWAVAQAAALQVELAKAYEECQFHVVYQKLHNYCVVDLGGCYLDILKDRLYTTGAKSLPRRSAQTAMWHILEAFVRWIAPVLSFTADEIWQLMPAREGSVFSQRWYALPSETGAGDPDWTRLLAAREAVRKALETLRAAGQIGSGLNAGVQLFADGELGAALRGVDEELRYWFITSGASVGALAAAPADATRFELEGQGMLALIASPVPHGKCERCWHQRPEVGSNAEHPTLCARCVENVAGAGESRRFV